MILERLFAVAAFVLVYGSPTNSFSAPTIRGVSAEAHSDIRIYGDSNNENILWVVPPTAGSLSLTNQQALFVGRDFCRTAASIDRRRATLSKGIERMIARLGDPDLSTSQFDEFSRRIDSLTARLKRISYTPEILSSGGLYSYTANAGFVEVLNKVRISNPGYLVQPINMTVESIVPSLKSDNGSQVDGSFEQFFLNIGIPEGSSLLAPVETVQIDVEVTKLAACYLQYPEIMTGNPDRFQFGFSINYSYPFLFLQSVKAQFNLLDIYERIEETRSEGGFFKSESYSSLIQSSETKKIMKVEVTSDTPLGRIELERLETSAREFVLNTAIRQMTRAANQAGKPPETGAAVAASELASTCGLNQYCAGAAAGLRVLDAIFKSSSSRSEARTRLEQEFIYDSVTGATLPVLGTVSYSVE